MANPFAYEEYRKDKIRQKIEESRTQRVQVKVSGPNMVFPLSNHKQKVQSLPLISCTADEAEKIVGITSFDFSSQYFWLFHSLTTPH